MPGQNTFVTEFQSPAHHKKRKTTYMIKKRVSPIEGMQKEFNAHRWMKYLFCAGACLCVTAVIIVAGLLPALIISLAQSASSTTISTTLNSGTNSNAGISATVTSTGNTTTQSTSGQGGSTVSTSTSPAGFSASGAVTSSTSQWYGYERVTLTCSVALTNFTATIIVQKTYQAIFNNLYSTFPAGSMNESYIETSSQIIYTWTLVSGQTIPASQNPYIFEAQFKLNNIYQNTTFDTFEITATTVTCLTSTVSGHF